MFLNGIEVCHKGPFRRCESDANLMQDVAN